MSFYQITHTLSSITYIYDSRGVFCRSLHGLGVICGNFCSAVKKFPRRKRARNCTESPTRESVTSRCTISGFLLIYRRIVLSQHAMAYIAGNISFRRIRNFSFLRIFSIQDRFERCDRKPVSNRLIYQLSAGFIKN